MIKCYLVFIVILLTAITEYLYGDILKVAGIKIRENAQSFEDNDHYQMDMINLSNLNAIIRDTDLLFHLNPHNGNIKEIYHDLIIMESNSITETYFLPGTVYSSQTQELVSGDDIWYYNLFNILLYADFTSEFKYGNDDYLYFTEPDLGKGSVTIKWLFTPDCGINNFELLRNDEIYMTSQGIENSRDFSFTENLGSFKNNLNLEADTIYSYQIRALDNDSRILQVSDTLKIYFDKNKYPYRVIRKSFIINRDQADYRLKLLKGWESGFNEICGKIETFRKFIHMDSHGDSLRVEGEFIAINTDRLLNMLGREHPENTYIARVAQGCSLYRDLFSDMKYVTQCLVLINDNTGRGDAPIEGGTLIRKDKIINLFVPRNRFFLRRNDA